MLLQDGLVLSDPVWADTAGTFVLWRSGRSTRSAAALLVLPPSPLLNRYGRVVLLKVLRAAARK